jgi:hypothetical protein
LGGRLWAEKAVTPAQVFRGSSWTHIGTSPPTIDVLQKVH